MEVVVNGNSFPKFYQRIKQQILSLIPFSLSLSFLLDPSHPFLVTRSDPPWILSLVSKLAMAPKQDSNTERVNVMESQIGDLTTGFEEMSKTAEAREQRAIEAERRAEERERRAEERHQQMMATKEKPPDAKPESNPSSENSGSKIVSSDETQRSSTEGSNPPARGLLPRTEKGVLVLPETAVPLRSVEIHTPHRGIGSSGHSPHQKNDSSPKKLDLPEFKGKNPDD